MAADTEVPGLNEIKKQAFAFLRPRGWDRVRAGLESIAAYAAEGTPRQKVAVLESLTRLAIYTRQRMPREVIADMLQLCEEATPYRLDDTPDSEMFDSAVTLAADVAGHVGYDAVLHMPERDGLLVVRLRPAPLAAASPCDERGATGARRCRSGAVREVHRRGEARDPEALDGRRPMV
jgi:hypothetical protein